MSLVKHINVNDGSGRKFTDNTVGEITLDTKPEVGSFNLVTSDAVARAVAGASGEVPQVTESDNGKVLKAVYDEGGPAVEWGEAQSGSTYTAGEGIKIESDAISVDHDGTLTRVYETVYLPTEVDESAASTFTTGSVTGNKYFKIQVGDNPDLNVTLDINTAPFDYDDTDERNIPVFNAPNADGVAVIVAIPNQAGGAAVPYRWELSSIVQADTTRASALYGFTHVIEAPDGQINTSLSLSDFIWGEQDPADYIDADGYLTLSIWWAESVERGTVTNLQSMDPGLALHYDDGVTENSWPVFSSSAHYEQETNKIKVAAPVPFVTSSDTILGVDPSSNMPAWIEKKSVFPSINSGDAGKVLGVTSDDHGGSIGWVAAGGGADQPLPAVGTNVLRFEFEDPTFNPTNDAGCNFTGTSWAKVTEATTRNIWDCTLASDPSSSNCFKITEKCKVIDGLYSRPLANLFSSRTNSTSGSAASTGLISVDIRLYGNSIYYKDASYAFSGCTELKEVRFRSYYEMDFSSAKSMFQMCYALESVTAKTVGSTGTSVGVFIGGSTNYMFRYCKSLKSISGFSIDASVTSLDAGNMFAGCSVLSSVDSMFSAVGSSFSISNARSMFSDCTKLVEIGSALKISATSIAGMFTGCASLERVALLDLNNVVTNATTAFRGCNSLAEVNIVNSGSVTDWSEAFSTKRDLGGNYVYSSNAPMLKLPSLDTSGATNVSNMFRGRKYADGALAMYNQLAQQANPPTSYNYCFTDCGSVTHAGDLAQIPSSWGGTGT